MMNDQDRYIRNVTAIGVCECSVCHETKKLDTEATIGFGSPACRQCMEQEVGG